MVNDVEVVGDIGDVTIVEGTLDVAPDVDVHGSPPIIICSDESFTSIDFGEFAGSSSSCCCSNK